MSTKEKIVGIVQLAGIVLVISAAFTDSKSKRHTRLVSGGLLFGGGLIFQYGMGKNFKVGKTK